MASEVPDVGSTECSVVRTGLQGSLWEPEVCSASRWSE